MHTHTQQYKKHTEQTKSILYALLTVFFGNEMMNSRKSSLRPSSIPDHHLFSSLNPAVSGSIQYLMSCGRCIIVTKVTCSAYWQQNNRHTFIAKMMRVGMRNTHRASISMASSAKGMCPPEKHCISPLTYHLCNREHAIHP